MSNVFEILKRMGGVVEENGVTYVTHPNPPANDDSQKIATTAWVRDITDSLEASVNGGMFPTVSKAVLSGNALKYSIISASITLSISFKPSLTFCGL